MSLDLGPLVDHHCHGLVTEDLDRDRFEALMNESDRASPLGTSVFDSMLGLAVRRWCAPVLDLDPHAPPEEYVARRAELGAAEANRRLLAASGITEFLVDTGLTPALVCSTGELAGMSGGQAHEVLRLEAVAEEVLHAGGPPSEFPERIVERLRGSEAVAAKSIAAYRVGLRLPDRPPNPEELLAALVEVRPDRVGRFRVAHPVVSGWLAWTAIEMDIPLQLHVGYGDSDLDLADCDPLLLTGFLRATADRDVPVLLLHNYPFHRHAAYLAQVFDHVFMDLGLATHNAGALSGTLLREALELVPFGKLLFSTDAYALAELYLLGARLFRTGLAAVLDGLVAADEMTAEDAERVGALMARDNAHRVYGLEGPHVAG